MQTILLIDSCALTRDCLSTILRAKGFRVQSAAQIAQAKTMIAKRPPDLILTEIRLPDDNALNLMRWINETPTVSSTRVCLLTNAAAKKPIMEAIELGASKVMLKSKFTVSSFLDTISALFETPPAQSGTGSATPDQTPELCFPIPEPAPDPTLALKVIKPVLTRKQLQDRLEEFGDLCALPEPIACLLEAIDTPETTIEQVAELLKMDQTIAMKVMRIANSSTYARGEQTTTLKDAVLRIGLEHLRELVAGLGMIDQFTGEGHSIDASGELDPVLLWTHALGVAVCSSKIATRCPGIDPETVFTGALLHDIGRMILIQTLPELYPRVLEAAHSMGVALELAEKRMLLSDHTSISQSMLIAWNLPKDLVEAIANHHIAPSKIAVRCPKNQNLVAAIALGNQMVHAMGIGSSGNRVISPTEDLFELLEVPELSVGSLVDGLEEEIELMRSLVYSSSDNQSPAPIRSQSDAPAFDRAFHPLYITMSPEHDAIGHWVMSHSDAQEHPEPNIVIVHLRQARDRQALSEKLETALASCKSDSVTSALPILMLSHTGKIALPEDLLRQHPSLHLMTPFSVLHFEQRVNHLLNGNIRPIEGWGARTAA
jgi:putative nucleotidyltransferase with HDIG domain